MTSTSYLALAIFPAPFASTEAWTGPGYAAHDAAPDVAGDASPGDRTPSFPPTFLAFLGTMLLVAPGDATGQAAGGADRVSVSLGLILAALVWRATQLVASLHAAPVTARGSV